MEKVPCECIWRLKTFNKVARTIYREAILMQITGLRLH